MQQATSAHSATGTLASSGKIENHSATRRGVLGLAASLGAAAMVSPVSAMPRIGRNNRSEWDRAMADIERLERAHGDAFDATDRALTGFYENRPMPPKHMGWVISHETIEQFRSRSKQEAAEFQRATEIARSTFQVDRCEELQHAAMEAERAAILHAMTIPAPDAAALEWKIDRMVIEDQADSYLPYIRSDVRRLRGAIS